MKKLFLVLLFVPLVSFGQDVEEAKNFIRTTYRTSTEANYAIGTIIPVLQISFTENNKVLVLKYKNRQITPNPSGYIISEIDLSKIIRIENEPNGNVLKNGKQYSFINIITKPFGMKNYTIDDDFFPISDFGETFYNEYFEKVGWYNDFIRLNDIKKGERILNALKFLAIENGAEIKESNF